MWHTAIVSGTEWENVWKQRCSPLAQPEFRLCAEMAQMLRSISEPRSVERGDWHTPMVEDIQPDEVHVVARAQISAARCARVSYLNHDGQRDLDLDRGLYRKLETAEPAHYSPLEHVATPQVMPRWEGNFYGWTQLRKTLSGEDGRRA